MFFVFKQRKNEPKLKNNDKIRITHANGKHTANIKAFESPSSFDTFTTTLDIIMLLTRGTFEDLG